MTKLMKKSPLRPPKGWFQWVVASVGYRGASADNSVVDSSAVECYAVKVEDIESQAWAVGLAMLLAAAMMVCIALACARKALRVRVGTEIEKATRESSTQTSDQSSPAYWGMLVDVLRRECMLRDLVVARTKLEIVDVLLQSDEAALYRPGAWMGLRATTNTYRA